MLPLIRVWTAQALELSSPMLFVVPGPHHALPWPDRVCPALLAKTGPPSACGPPNWVSTWLEGCGSVQGHPVARVDNKNACTLPCLALLADSCAGGGRVAPGRRALLSLAPSLTWLSFLVLKHKGGALALCGRKGFCSRTDTSWEDPGVEWSLVPASSCDGLVPNAGSHQSRCWSHLSPKGEARI